MIRLDLSDLIYTHGEGVFTSSPNLFIVARLTVDDIIVELKRNTASPKDMYYYQFQNLTQGIVLNEEMIQHIPSLKDILLHMQEMVFIYSDEKISVFVDVVRPGSIEVLTESLHDYLINVTAGVVELSLSHHAIEDDGYLMLVAGSQSESDETIHTGQFHEVIHGYLQSEQAMLEGGIYS